MGIGVYRRRQYKPHAASAIASGILPIELYNVTTWTDSLTSDYFDSRYVVLSGSNYKIVDAGQSNDYQVSTTELSSSDAVYERDVSLETWGYYPGEDGQPGSYGFQGNYFGLIGLETYSVEWYDPNGPISAIAKLPYAIYSLTDEENLFEFYSVQGQSEGGVYPFEVDIVFYAAHQYYDSSLHDETSNNAETPAPYLLSQSTVVIGWINPEDSNSNLLCTVIQNPNEILGNEYASVTVVLNNVIVSQSTTRIFSELAIGYESIPLSIGITGQQYAVIAGETAYDSWQSPFSWNVVVNNGGVNSGIIDSGALTEQDMQGLIGAVPYSKILGSAANTVQPVLVEWGWTNITSDGGLFTIPSEVPNVT